MRISNLQINTTKKTMLIILWVIIWLFAFDCCVNFLFQYPKDFQKKPNWFQEYFDYGRSIEGKVRRKILMEDQYNAAIAQEKLLDTNKLKGGWLDTCRFKDIPIEGSKTGKIITIYGMSHANALAGTMIKIRTHRIRNITTGGAPPNWAYAAFQIDHKLIHSDVAILAVMTQGVPMISSTSGMTAFFEHPYTYTFPLYTQTKSGLVIRMPPFYTREVFIEYMNNPIKLESYTQWLAQHDKYYSVFLFNQGATDYSVIFRALKRAYFSTFIYSKSKDVYNSITGFNEETYEVNILKKILHDFAYTAKKNNIIPFIYIVNNQFCGDDLFRLLKPLLDSNRIPYLSTHFLCPPSDPMKYDAGGHFTDNKNYNLAKAILYSIDKNDTLSTK